MEVRLHVSTTTSSNEEHVGPRHGQSARVDGVKLSKDMRKQPKTMQRDHGGLRESAGGSPQHRPLRYDFGSILASLAGRTR
jgi:hypothetical protein